MNAMPSGSPSACGDADILVEVILHLDPKAAHAHSRAFSKVRSTLLSWGWSENRFESAVRQLRSNRGLFLSNSRKTMSLEPLSNPHSVKNRCCAYCRKMTRNLTKDHVIPRLKAARKVPPTLSWLVSHAIRLKRTELPLSGPRTF